MKMFDQLVTIKNLREENADRTARAQGRVLAEAVVQRDAAQRRLQDFRDFSGEQERKLYQSLCARVVLLRDIQDAQGQVQSLRLRESDHRDNLQDAEAHRDQQERQLVADRQAHLLALRMRDKFVDLAEVYAQQEGAESERKEEAEIEEAAESRTPLSGATGEGA